MVKSLMIFLLLSYNLIAINPMVAGRYDEQWNSADFRRHPIFQVMRPTNNLGEKSIDMNNVNAKKQQEKFFSELENWTGRWLPENDPIPASSSFINSDINHSEMHHTIAMGNRFPDCDDGKNRLAVDWDNSSVNYTCYGGKITPSYNIDPQWLCENISPYYKALHRCMNQTIEYDDNIPVFGTHRPVWPVYGEYKFLPRQRWIHSLEHGAVVMLYHPCANPLEVQRLKNLIRQCLRRHIITNYNLLDIDRPLALVTWGCKLTMSYVDKNLVREFINKKALRGPENIADDGEFDAGILTVAQTVSDKADSQLCPLLE